MYRITIFTLWSWDPSVILGCAGMVAGYLLVVKERTRQSTLWFLAGVVVLFLALESPLEHLGDTYLFSAHMLQHLLLFLIVPPALLLGMTRPAIQKVLNWDFARRCERFLGRPAVAWLLATFTIWAWHLPALYNATLANENIHIMEHLSFLVTATIFWWPILSPIERLRLESLPAIPYLFLAAASNSLLGILLTFAKPGLYPAYLHPADDFGVLAILRESWGITPAIDQQAGGLLMWVPGSLVYLVGILAVLFRWYGQAEEEIAWNEK